MKLVYAERLGAFRASADSVPLGEYILLKIAEGDAKRDLETARGELSQHKRNHRKAN